MNFTYGAELEWADVDARLFINPTIGSWSKKEWTIVNSDGKANDPELIRNHFGGEINTVPTNSLAEQLLNIEGLIEFLSPKALYRGNIQYHIGYEGAKENIDLMKKIFKYTEENQDFVYFDMLPRDPAEPKDYPNPEDLKLAKKFDRQRNLWNKRGVPSDRAEKILKASTAKEFYDEHYFFNEKTQRRLYHLGTFRAGINVRALYTNGTVEFRCFPGSTDIDEIRHCFVFCEEFIKAAIYTPERTAKDIYESREWKFPKWQKFDPELEKGFNATKHRPE